MQQKPESDLSPTPKAKPAADHTGQRDLVKNVMFSWAGQSVFIIAGFVMPRLIDQHLGREMLGIWDLCWALLNYFSFLAGGVTSAVNRYVGRLWATQDIAGISKVVSCATVPLSIAGMLIAVVSVIGAYLLPQLIGERLGSHAQDARWVFLFLGLSVSVQTALGAFNGVITGCHRWDLKNAIHAGCYGVGAVAMGMVLYFGGGLVHLAIIIFISECLGHGTRMLVSFRVCPGLKLRVSLIERALLKELQMYGGKTLLPQITNMLQGTSTSMMVAIFLGPGALALVMRPQSLVRHGNTLVRRMTLTLVPTVGSLQATDQSREIRGLLIRSVRYTLYLQLPIVLGLAVFGAPVIGLWMGPDYARVTLIAIAAILSIGPTVAMPMMQVLGGLNAHGRAGVAQLVGAVFSIALVSIVLMSGHGIEAAAICMLIPVNFVSLIYLPHLVGRHIGMKSSVLISKAIVAPILHLLPLGIGLLTVRLAMLDHPFGAMLLSCILFGPFTAVFYWKRVLPARLKESLVKRLNRFRRSALLS